MAGIYVHIPFCKSRCAYCDFYTEVAPHLLDDCIAAISREILFRKNYLADESIQTVYFGGGTPSLLSPAHYDLLFNNIFKYFKIENDPEITFEANPDDLSNDFFCNIKSFPFNRISIGVQSFDDEDLRRINRRHNAFQALGSIEKARKYGFSNISVDLIYGLPFQTLEKWEKQLDTFFSLNIPHLSAYNLTYESGTLLKKQLDKALIKELPDELIVEMFKLLRRKVLENQYEVYEISNYAKKNFRSKHNSAYWNRTPYVGFGPSAHSYDGRSRQWNYSSIKQYIKAIDKGESFFELEKLSFSEQYNDYIMLSLRTSEGINKKYLKENFGEQFFDFCIQNIKIYIENKKMKDTGTHFRLTEDGFLLSNLIMSDLMYV